MKVDTRKIAVLMAENSLTQIELAKRAGLCGQQISAVIRRGGTCQPATAGKLAVGLGVPVTEIMLEV